MGMAIDLANLSIEELKALKDEIRKRTGGGKAKRAELIKLIEPEANAISTKLVASVPKFRVVIVNDGKALSIKAGSLRGPRDPNKPKAPKKEKKDNGKKK